MEKGKYVGGKEGEKVGLGGESVRYVDVQTRGSSGFDSLSSGVRIVRDCTVVRERERGGRTGDGLSYLMVPGQQVGC